MKFPIRIGLIWRPFMLFLGATPANSYVELTDDDIRVRFGPGFDRTIPRANVADAFHSKWGFINGMGIIAGGTLFGVVGSTGGIVELALTDTVQLRFVGFPWNTRRIAISLEDPQGFIDAVMSGAKAS